MFCSRLRLYASGGNFSLCVCSLTSRFADSHQLFVWMRQKKPVHARNSREERNTRRHVGVREESRVRRKNVRCLFKVFLFFFFPGMWHWWKNTQIRHASFIYIKKKTYKSRFYAISSLHNMITTTLWPRLITTFSLLLRSFGSKLRDRQPAPAALGQFVISTNKTHYNIVILYKSSATMTSWLRVLERNTAVFVPEVNQLLTTECKNRNAPSIMISSVKYKNPPPPPKKKVNLSSLETDKTEYSSGNDTWP